MDYGDSPDRIPKIISDKFRTKFTKKCAEIDRGIKYASEWKTNPGNSPALNLKNALILMLGDRETKEKHIPIMGSKNGTTNYYLSQNSIILHLQEKWPLVLKEIDGSLIAETLERNTAKVCINKKKLDDYIGILGLTCNLTVGERHASILNNMTEKYDRFPYRVMEKLLDKTTAAKGITVDKDKKEIVMDLARFNENAGFSKYKPMSKWVEWCKNDNIGYTVANDGKSITINLRDAITLENAYKELLTNAKYNAAGIFGRQSHGGYGR